MSLIYEKMKKEKIVNDDKLKFLFSIYSRLVIKLDKESFTLKNGVPQGGINSPILFNFAMFFFLSEAASIINQRKRQSCGLPKLPDLIIPKKNFLWADDLATLLKAHPNRAKEFIKIYFEVLIEVGEKWGLTINFSKSAIMDFFSRSTSYNHLSDYQTTWDKKKGTELKLDISVKGVKTTINIPLVTEYKYLGILISRDLTPQAHLQMIAKKITYITNAFKSVGGVSDSLKFCVNTWHVFIRPLLDYSQTYFSFLEDHHRELLYSLYRKSARKMMFLKKYTPNKLVEKLIQYDYRNLHIEFKRVAQNKMFGRQECTIEDEILEEKVNFNYNRIDLSTIPLQWVKVWNMVYYPRKAQLDSLTSNKILDELGIDNVKNFMNKFLVFPVNKFDLIILDKIYNFSQSTL